MMKKIIYLQTLLKCLQSFCRLIVKLNFWDFDFNQFDFNPNNIGPLFVVITLLRSGSNKCAHMSWTYTWISNILLTTPHFLSFFSFPQLKNLIYSALFKRKLHTYLCKRILKIAKRLYQNLSLFYSHISADFAS